VESEVMLQKRVTFGSNRGFDSTAHRLLTKACAGRVAVLLLMCVAIILVFAVFKAHQRIGTWLDWYESSSYLARRLRISA
jgi:hypothetical protein